MNQIVEENYFDVLRHWSNECIDELVAYLNLIQSGKMKIIHLPNIMKDTLTKLPCFIKYNSYTSSTNVPVKVREVVEVK